MTWRLALTPWFLIVLFVVGAGIMYVVALTAAAIENKKTCRAQERQIRALQRELVLQVQANEQLQLRNQKIIEAQGKHLKFKAKNQ